MQTYEIQYDDHTIIIGDLVEVDDSIHHAHGVEKRSYFEVKNLSIIVYIGDIDYDITKALSDKQLTYFMDEFLLKLKDEEL